jgi:hypothetical protein
LWSQGSCISTVGRYGNEEAMCHMSRNTEVHKYISTCIIRTPKMISLEPYSCLVLSQ